MCFGSSEPVVTSSYQTWCQLCLEFTYWPLTSDGFRVSLSRYPTFSSAPDVIVPSFANRCEVVTRVRNSLCVGQYVLLRLSIGRKILCAACSPGLPCLQPYPPPPTCHFLFGGKKTCDKPRTRFYVCISSFHFCRKMKTYPQCPSGDNVGECGSSVLWKMSKRGF